MHTRISPDYQAGLKGSGIRFSEDKGYYYKKDGETEFFTKAEAKQISKIMISERARINIENRETFGKPFRASTNARVARSFKGGSYRALLKEKKSRNAFHERQRVVRSLEEENYIISLLHDYFPSISEEDMFLSLTPEKIAAIMAKVISPYSATARLSDPEGALEILGIQQNQEETNDE